MNDAPNETLIPIDGLRNIRAWMVFDFRGCFSNLVVVQAGDRRAHWNIPEYGHRHVRFFGGDRTLKPRNCDGAANYIRHYVITHATNFEQLLKS